MVERMISAEKLDCVVRTADQLGETPLWCDRTRKLWWVDIERPKLQSFDLSSGRHDVFPDPDVTYLGGQAFTSSGGHLLARDLSLFTRSDDGELRFFTEIESGIDNRLNDGRVDAWGRLWIGTMDNQLHRPNGALYRVDPDGTVERIFDQVIVSNGIAFSPDRRRMHFTDTRRYQSWVLDVDPLTGSVAERRMFADYSATGDRPDGACFDVDGGLWTVFFGGGRVVRYAPDGRLDTVLSMPVSNPTCVCFGGRDYRTLFITTASKFLTEEQRAAEPMAGAVFALEGVAQGFAEHRFAI
ncbi:SMP-30/gluconolactonase/LRE family protein [Neorhizobium vignae]|uniref:SMP-30/gluconolactonase/LRE family protein n=1 Tax=Neorhizobium vignae TaxID=690585 RepID=UPI00068BECF5|nr:SMP-30/gluconolactonase/LRE family protein [Neorhizobium vignae]